jgi:hypothetical protein
MKVINNRYHCTGQSLSLEKDRVVIEDQDYWKRKSYIFFYKGIKKICRDNAIFYVFNTICAYEGNKNIHFPYRNSLTISIIPTGEKIYYGFDEHIARNVTGLSLRDKSVALYYGLEEHIARNVNVKGSFIQPEEKKGTNVEIIFSEWANDIEPIKDWLDAHSE